MDQQKTRQAPGLPAGAERLLAGPHTGVLTTLRRDGSAHLAPVRFSWDDEAGLIRVMTTGSRAKIRNIRANPDRPIAICQAVQFRWITFEGLATVSEDPERVAEGVRRYILRYAAPPPNLPGLVVIEIAVHHVMGIL
ncbi:TIGR03618 family F420-dependent PPOX class oxidoreductase [Streptomyces sp. B1866]|uniref:pyridoxamine 5'-phosphate oxidase family protein n=1 Tax=Streptomyces sp. B1866 TaxID=3075431 RepID=UPI00288E5C70|nr:TIGR03618 family F420-dependent PPOX class oxidoreductase [Streptomyces sp. B1866]MDT3397076.1 TIGR03618 family F420-dependent PPOX class oxidoreductase [Streptomyces sp. B1866]